MLESPAINGGLKAAAALAVRPQKDVRVVDHTYQITVPFVSFGNREAAIIRDRGWFVRLLLFSCKTDEEARSWL